jgi:hypothetical protein
MSDKSESSGKKIFVDLCHGFREIGILLVALAPLDGILEGHKLTDATITNFIYSGIGIYFIGALIEPAGISLWRTLKKHYEKLEVRKMPITLTLVVIVIAGAVLGLCYMTLHGSWSGYFANTAAELKEKAANVKHEDPKPKVAKPNGEKTGWSDGDDPSESSPILGSPALGATLAQRAEQASRYVKDQHNSATQALRLKRFASRAYKGMDLLAQIRMIQAMQEELASTPLNGAKDVAEIASRFINNEISGKKAEEKEKSIQQRA